MQQVFVFSFCVTFLFSLISFVFQLYVARKLNQQGVNTGRFYTTGGAIVAFVKGWQHADALGLRALMIVWSIVFGIAIVSAIVVIVAMASMPRPPRN
jgi:hypothetical protein